ncbi:MAG: PIN domain-containing protein [Gemmatimonadaceae bacterium]
MAADSASYVSYMETSMILAAILDEDAGAFARLNVTTPRITSALTVAEASRAIRRARAAERIGARQERTADVALEVFFGTCSVIDINGEILLHAGRGFPIEPIRTLDAIHLATIASLEIPPHLVRVITRDRRVRDNAIAMGYAVA